MNNSDQIEKLKKLPPLTQQVCGSCRFYKMGHMGISWHEYYNCTAISMRAKDAWPHCQGAYWQPHPSAVPVLIRLKRWLIG